MSVYVSVCPSDVTHRTDFRIARSSYVRSSKKNEFWDFFDVFVKVFLVRFCCDESRAGLHDRMITGLHDRKIICGKVRIFFIL